VTERDYILATNLARLYLLADVLRSLTSGLPEIHDLERMAVTRYADAWVLRTQKALDKALVKA
jgi:hypothetical protein